MPARRPCSIGWEDQIRRVLAEAREPLTTIEIGRRARVIPTGKYAESDLSKRQAGDPGQECYRILRRLYEQGLVRRDDDGTTARWRATSILRGKARRSIAQLDALYELPAYGEVD